MSGSRPRIFALAFAPLTLLAQCEPSCAPTDPGPGPTTVVVPTTVAATPPRNESEWVVLDGDPRAYPNVSSDGRRLVTFEGVVDTVSGHLLRAHPDPFSIPWRISPSGAAVLYQDGIGRDTWHSVFVGTGVSTPVDDWCGLGEVNGWEGLVAVRPPFNAIDPCLLHSDRQIPFVGLSVEGRYGVRTFFLGRPDLVEVRDMSTDAVVTQYEDDDWRPAGVPGVSDEGHLMVRNERTRQLGILPPGSRSVANIVLMTSSLEGVDLITADGSGVIGWSPNTLSDPDIVLVDSSSTTVIGRRSNTQYGGCPRLSYGGRVVSVSYQC
jgi:hypothetical protein